jgi:hypothetical protein
MPAEPAQNEQLITPNSLITQFRPVHPGPALGHTQRLESQGCSGAKPNPALSNPPHPRPRDQHIPVWNPGTHWPHLSCPHFLIQPLTWSTA